MTTTQVDIIIVGSGIVGLTLACALGDSPFRIALIDGREPPLGWPDEGYDPRVSAITVASQNIFNTLGIWKTMANLRIARFTDMHVWDAEGQGLIHFNAAENLRPELGHIIENRVMLKALYERVKQFPNIECLFPHKAAELSQYDDHAAIELDSGRRITARLIVGADGARSWVREQLGTEMTTWPYGHTAIVSTVQCEKPHELTAWQRFLPTGPLAFLPLADKHMCSIVWSCEHAEAERLLALDKDAFNNSLAQAFDHKLGTIVESSDLASFPLTMRHAKHYVKNRVALIGDAAHTIHPLAGQGVNMGLLDAACLAEVLVMAESKDKDIGVAPVLRRYERWRKGHNLSMVAAMESFKRLFGTQQGAVVALRNFGLRVTNRFGPLKNFFMQHAMGLKGDLPSMAKRGNIFRE